MLCYKYLNRLYPVCIICFFLVPILTLNELNDLELKVTRTIVEFYHCYYYKWT